MVVPSVPVQIPQRRIRNMATKLPGKRLMAFVIAAFLSCTGWAQEFQPLIEPDYFGPDLQFFAPAVVDDYGGQQLARTGFFATYERVFTNVSRPKDAPPDNLGFPQIGDPGTQPASIQGQFGSFEGDWTWGDRYELGYMTQDDHGWLCSVTTVTGPNSSYIIPQDSLEGFVGGEDGGGTVPNIPAIIGLEQSLNKASLTSVEVNKVWRADPFHNGTVFEPMVGVRYARFIDYYKHDIYGRFDADPLSGYPDFLVPNIDGPFEVIRTRKADFDNMMLGGQLGFRLHRQFGHWSLSGEVRAFAMQNWQFLSIYEQQTAYQYEQGTPPQPRIQTINTSAPPTYVDNHEFVWGGEFRGNVSYDITRDIMLKFGVTVLDLGQGVGRGGNLNGGNQDVLMAGLNFGISYNR